MTIFDSTLENIYDDKVITSQSESRAEGIVETTLPNKSSNLETNVQMIQTQIETPIKTKIETKTGGKTSEFDFWLNFTCILATIVIHLGILFYKWGFEGSIKYHDLTDKKGRKAFLYTIEATMHKVVGFFWPVFAVPLFYFDVHKNNKNYGWKMIWNSIRTIFYSALLYVYPIYNVCKRYGSSGDWFYNSSFFVNHFDYVIGAIMGFVLIVIVFVCLFLTMGNKKNIPYSVIPKPFKYIHRFIALFGIFCALCILLFSLYLTKKSLNILNPHTKYGGPGVCLCSGVPVTNPDLYSLSFTNVEK